MGLVYVHLMTYMGIYFHLESMAKIADSAWSFIEDEVRWYI